MSGLDDSSLIAGFVVFCRIGACLSFAPGFSSARIPVRLRLFAALGLTVALSPAIATEAEAPFANLESSRLAAFIVQECATGAAMGMMARTVFSSLETMFAAASMSIGMTSSFAPRIDEGDSTPELAAFVLFATTSLLFVSDLHWEIAHAIRDSYTALPIGYSLTPRLAVANMAETLSFGFSLAFRLASPFLVFGLVSNFGFALVNKITPQIAIYFVAAPFVLVGGLSLLAVAYPNISMKFLSAFEAWLRRI